VLGGSLLLLTKSSGESLRDDFVSRLALNGDARLVVADTEERLRTLAEHNHTERLWLRWTSAAMVGVGALGLAATQTSPWLGTNGQSEHNAAILSDALFTGLGAALFVRSLFPTAEERMWTLWSQDPGLQRTAVRSPGPSVHVIVGLGAAGVAGRF
jgi:hypothetical protein